MESEIYSVKELKDSTEQMENIDQIMRDVNQSNSLKNRILLSLSKHPQEENLDFEIKDKTGRDLVIILKKNFKKDLMFYVQTKNSITT